MKTQLRNYNNKNTARAFQAHIYRTVCLTGPLCKSKIKYLLHKCNGKLEKMTKNRSLPDTGAVEGLLGVCPQGGATTPERYSVEALGHHHTKVQEKLELRSTLLL